MYWIAVSFSCSYCNHCKVVLCRCTMQRNANVQQKKFHCDESKDVEVSDLFQNICSKPITARNCLVTPAFWARPPDVVLFWYLHYLKAQTPYNARSQLAMTTKDESTENEKGSEWIYHPQYRLSFITICIHISQNLYFLFYSSTIKNRSRHMEFPL